MAMLRRGALLALACTALAAQSVRSEVLGNGLTLVVQKQSLSHALELRLVVRAGPLHEGGLLLRGCERSIQGAPEVLFTAEQPQPLARSFADFGGIGAEE